MAKTYAYGFDQECDAMRLRVLAVPFLTLGIALLSSPTRADPIRVTAGALVGDSFGAELNATGERGFAISAAGDEVGGIYRPAADCNGSSCFPGQVIPITASWSGGDFSGVVSIEGETFPIGMTSANHGSALVSFDGSLTLPPFVRDPSVSLIAPFTFSGILFFPFPEGQHEQRREDLVGAGNATLQFQWSSAASAWLYEGGRYDFAPIPEPGSLMLVATGAGVLLGRRRLRRRRVG
jgi:hypothetical protein